jgi:integrase
MLAHGVPVPTVSQRLGHTRVPTTLNVYPHRIPGADRQAADLLADLIDHT